jgi:hypothetical protein
MPLWTEATLNVLRTNKAPEVLEDLLKAYKHAEVIRIQENTTPAVEKAIRRFVEETGAMVHHARECPIIWNPKAFQAADLGSLRRTHPGKAGVSPGRLYSWQPLLHVPSDTHTLVVNTHAVAGYAKTGNDAPGSQDYRDEAAQYHWLTGVALLGEWMVEIERGRYDGVGIGGDFNARMNNFDEWWYPAPLIGPLLREDDKQDSIDHILYTRNSRIKVGRRWAVNVNSDHNLHLAGIERA